MAYNYLWGIDLGGTKIEAAILDVNNHFKIIERRRTPTNASQGYEAVIQNIKLLVRGIESDLNIKCQKLGIGTPGSINPNTNNLRNCNSVYLNGKPFRKDLEEALGVPVKMTNDANCFAMSEYKMGAVKEMGIDANSVFGVIMGTGVGSGIIINGHLVEGKNGIGGEWGHNFLDDSGGKCYCGKIGCVETVLSGPSLERYYLEKSGTSKTLKNIVNDYRSGKDKFSLETMERLFHYFPLAISNVINIIDPDVIVLGGGLGNINELYTHGLVKLPEFVFSDYIETKFVKPLFGDSSGVLGAALLWT